MSDRTLSEVVDGLRRLKKAAGNLGCTLDDPFMSMSFLSLPVIPELKVTDKGLFDVNEFKLVDLFA
jgi:adenine deaminase